MNQAVFDENQAVQVGRACLCFNLRKASRLVTQLYDQALKPAGLRVTQFSLLMALRARPGARLGKLARLLGMDRTTLTRNLDLLAQRGLVRLEPGRDRREQRVSLSDEGARALQAAMPFWREVQGRMGELLGGPGLDEFLARLQGLSAELG